MPIDKEYLLQYCKENYYPEEACATLLEMLDTLSANEKAVSVFRQQELLYRRDLSTDFEGMIRRITLLAEELELDVRIVHQLFLICLTPALHEKHQKAGLPEELYDKIQWDVYRKLMECHEVHGVWGTVTATWNTRAFQLTRFQLGRLQFEPIYAYASYEDGDLSVKEGDTVNVIAGVWKDTIGVVRAINRSKQSVTINVELFGRETPVEISFTDIRKM